MAIRPVPEISITLTASQVQHVIRSSSRSDAPGLHTLLAGAGARGALSDGPGGAPRTESTPAHTRAPVPPVDPRLSRSLLRGLALLARFGPGRARGVVELAGELQMSPSTAHRYVLTLVEAGLLEQIPGTRKYRLAGTGDHREQS